MTQNLATHLASIDDI